MEVKINRSRQVVFWKEALRASSAAASAGAASSAAASAGVASSAAASAGAALEAELEAALESGVIPGPHFAAVPLADLSPKQRNAVGELGLSEDE